MTIVKTTYKCDICKKEYPSKHYIGGLIAIHLHHLHDIEYKEVCNECTHKIAGFVYDMAVESPVMKMEELEQLCDE